MQNENRPIVNTVLENSNNIQGDYSENYTNVFSSDPSFRSFMGERNSDFALPLQTQQQQQQQQQQQADREEAKRLLDAVIDNEDRKTAKKYREKQDRSNKPPQQKDW